MDYSSVPNKRTGGNKRTRGNIPQKLISAQVQNKRTGAHFTCISNYIRKNINRYNQFSTILRHFRPFSSSIYLMFPKFVPFLKIILLKLISAQVLNKSAQVGKISENK